MKKTNLYLLLLGNILSNIGSGVTMLAIPWLLANSPGGKKIYGFTVIGATLASMILLPFFGVLIDRFSRKRILLFSQFIGVFITCYFAFELWSKAPQNFSLIFIYSCGIIGYFLYYPTIIALVQELFEPEEYKHINGLMEVQGQIAMMAAGGVGGLVIDKLPLAWILAADAITYILSIALFVAVSYQPKSKETSSQTSIWAGVTFLKLHPSRGIFWLSTIIPAILVGVSNYLFPIHIKQTLNADATIFGIGEIFWSFGAIMAGITIPMLIKRIGSVYALIWPFFAYLICLLLHSINPMAWGFVVIVLFMGWSNAGIRVARNTAMMQLINQDEIGRVNTILMAIGSFLQICLILFFSFALNTYSTFFGFFVLLCILAIFFCLAWKNKNPIIEDLQKKSCR